MKNNIVKSFLYRAVFAVIFLSIFASVGSYFYQQYSFSNFLAYEIKKEVDKSLKQYDKELKLSNMQTLENDVINLMKELGFVYIEIYDQNKEEFFSYEAKAQDFVQKQLLIDANEALFIHTFPTTKKIDYKFVEINNSYFLQIFYPVYKKQKLLGYIEGISYIDSQIVSQFKRDIFATIIMVILTILAFSVLIFPLIFFAYKQLNKNRLELLSSNIMTINTLGNAIALRDSDTNEHNYRVTLYAIKLAQKLNLEKEQIQKLIKGAFLHDVGKIGISDNILLKNGKLTSQEFETMKQHVAKGVSLIKGNSWLSDSKDVILYHHEKYDGSGYLNGLKGEQIPQNARIFAIVDVFDALTSKRPYKEPFSYEKSIKILENDAHTHFDPKLLEVFFSISKELYDDVRLKTQEELQSELDSLINVYF